MACQGGVPNSFGGWGGLQKEEGTGEIRNAAEKVGN